MDKLAIDLSYAMSGYNGGIVCPRCTHLVGDKLFKAVCVVDCRCCQMCLPVAIVVGTTLFLLNSLPTVFQRPRHRTSRPLIMALPVRSPACTMLHLFHPFPQPIPFNRL